MTLKGREVKPLEWACNEIVMRAKNKGYETKGPVRIPTKILRITTRKSPCGEGTNTWDRYEMRIHKRVIDIHCPSSVVKDITTFKIDASVDVNLIVWKQWSKWSELSRAQFVWFDITVFGREGLRALVQGAERKSVYISQSILKWIYYIMNIQVLINNPKTQTLFI